MAMLSSTRKIDRQIDNLQPVHPLCSYVNLTFLLCFLPISCQLLMQLQTSCGGKKVTPQKHVCQCVCENIVSVGACSRISTLCRMFFFLLFHSVETESLFSLRQNVLKSRCLSLEIFSFLLCRQPKSVFCCCCCFHPPYKQHANIHKGIYSN